MRAAYIYKITNMTNNKCYVGFTESPDYRWLEHQTCENYETMPLHRAIRDEGKENFKFEILYKSANVEHTLFTMEPYFIGLHNSHSSKGGYNVNYGGDHPYIKRDGYAILLTDSNKSLVDGEHYEVQAHGVKTSPAKRRQSLTELLGSIALKDTESFMNSVHEVFDMLDAREKEKTTNKTPKKSWQVQPSQPKTQKERGIDLIKRIQNDGRSALGRWYIAYGDEIRCYSDRKHFIKFVETQLNASPTKMITIASSINRKNQRLSWELLHKHNHRGIFVVFVEEHLLFDVPIERRKKKFFVPRCNKEPNIFYRKRSSDGIQ